MKPLQEPGAIPLNSKGQGVRFSLYSSTARAVKVAVFDPALARLKGIFALLKTHNECWSAEVNCAEAGDYYVFHVAHTHEIRVGHYYNARHGLTDPYARELVATGGQCGMPELVSVVREPLSAVPQESKPSVPWRDTVIYEAHVKGLTRLCDDIEPALRGKYLGVCQPPVIEHLKSLGITTLELMPCQAMMDELWLQRKGLTNYWGYNPVAMMAPTSRYAVEDPVTEFRTMVDTLHGAGIEVVVDLVFNHSAEGDSTGPVVSFKGIDVAGYYLINDRHKEPFVNYTGCGNSFNAMNPRVIQLWMDTLRLWYRELGVDGFRFDLGVTLGRQGEHFLTNHPFFIAMEQDPELRHAKIIMEPWDLGPNGYQVGKFPTTFAEWNGSFRDTVRTYIRGDGGTLQEFATQFVASFDKHFQEKDRGESSVNFITAHDGFTLQDLVSYQDKHNEANGENNRDGCHENHSRNYGEEGDSDNPDVLKMRLAQKRNFLTVLALAKGIPMLLMGDEMGRTQKGNNNAYCQDNELSWFNWQTDKQRDLRGLWRTLTTLRKAHCWIHQPATRIHWYRPDGKFMAQSDWEKWYARSVGCHFHGAGGKTLFIIFNMHHGEIEYQLPHTATDDTFEYRLLLDTARFQDSKETAETSVEPKMVRSYLASSHSISLFVGLGQVPKGVPKEAPEEVPKNATPSTNASQRNTKGDL